MTRFYQLFIALVWWTSSCFATDFTSIDKDAKSAPPTLHTATDIAHHLSRNLTTDTEKLRAFYIWIAHNIKYDYASVGISKQYTNTNDLVVEVLARRTGLCQHYSELFKACCDAVGIKAWVISGYTRDSLGHIATLSHAWNAVKIDGQYAMLDITWSAGYAQNGKYYNRFRDLYFLVPPQKFVLTHLPFDPIWQFSSLPITHLEAQKGDFRKALTHSNFNFKDSINAYLQRTPTDKLALEIHRIKQAGITNPLIAKHVQQAERHLAVIHSNSAREQFNAAANTFKKGADAFNTFGSLLKKQNGKMSAMKNDMHLLDEAEQTVKHSITQLRSIHAENKQMQQNIDTLINNATELIKAIDEIRTFK